MEEDNFLATTDANNQKQFIETEFVMNTSTSAIVSQDIAHTVDGNPDVRVWVRPTLIANCWKPLTDLQVTDFSAGTFEQVRGQFGVAESTSLVTVALRPTSPSSIAVTVRVRIYYND